MRILFSSTSGPGHILPMVPLARAFSTSGHDVLWATAAGAVPLVDAAGINAVAVGPDAAEELALRRAVREAAVDVPPAQRAAYVFPRMFGEALAPRMLSDLLGTADDWRPDLLIHEQGELASPLVGALTGTPSVTHAFGGAVPAEILVETQQRVAGMWHEQGAEVPPYAGCFEEVYLDIWPVSTRTVAIDHIADVQPLRPVTVSVRDPQEPPLVFVTMGTVQNRALDLGPLVAAVSELDVEVLVSVGRDGNVDLGSQRPTVRVERWVAQTQVLERSSVVVSHSGSGTFLGALAHGLPQLCLPQAADQFRNAAGGCRAGAALALMPDQISPEAVATAVSRLLDDREIRSGAERVAAEIAAMPSSEDVVRVLGERFAPTRS